MMFLSADQLPLAGFGQYGLAGLIETVLLWVGWQWIKREKERADANDAEVKRLNTIIQEKVVPALETSNRALEAVERKRRST